MVATSILLGFNEAANEILPSDGAGNLEDFTDDQTSTPALDLPTSVDALTGKGRLFTADKGLIASELVANATRHRRSVTIEAFVNFDRAAATVDGTIMARGVGGSDAERILYGLRLKPTGVSPNTEIQMFWQTAAGVDVAVTPVAFSSPDGFIHVAAIREWVSTTEAQVTYILNGDVIGSATEVSADIGNGEGGTTSVGAKGDALGDYEDFFEGIIDAIRVTDSALAPEEIRNEFRRVSIHQPNGYKIIKALAPPGIPQPPYSRDPDSFVQREFAIEGDAIGHVYAKAEQLLDILPDRPYREVLTRWESILGLKVFAGDTLATRRARILGHTSVLRGYARQDVPATLANLLDQTVAAVDVRNFSSLIGPDAFTGSLDAYTTHQGNGVVATAAGKLHIDAPTATNLRWDVNDKNAPMLLHATTPPGIGVDVSTLIEGWTFGGHDDAVAGIVFLNGITQEWFAFGVSRKGGADRLVHQRFVDGAIEAAVILEDPYSVDPSFLRATAEGTSGLFTLRYGGSTYDDPAATVVTGVTGITPFHFVGLAFIDTGASTGGEGDFDFDDLRIFDRNGRSPFAWYIYRDLGLGGNPDLLGARATLKKIKPAHTEAEVITDLEFLVDDDLLGFTPFDIV